MISIDKLIELHNQARSKAWFAKPNPLEKDESLCRYAAEWAENMANTKRLKHSSMSNIMQLGFRSAGENIAYGQKDEESVMKTWMRSPGHKRNIMNKSFTHIGCGFYDANGVVYWCVCFGKKN